MMLDQLNWPQLVLCRMKFTSLTSYMTGGGFLVCS